ncbi:MAG: ATP citrate lyase citrate-binding domain-containing protein [Candidatus Saccharimonadales bacterium]
MPRRKISEFRSKTMVNDVLGMTYVGWSVNSSTNLDVITGYDTYVVKVDQAVKGRFKKGLVVLDVSKSKLNDAVKTLRDQGYELLLVEPFFEHEDLQERYIAITQSRDGIAVSISANGGVDVEKNKDSIHAYTISDELDWNLLSKESQFSVEQLKNLVELFTAEYLTFLEINPYVVTTSAVQILDVAMEVDDAGLHFVNLWTEKDIRNPRSMNSYTQEDVVKSLDRESSSSFNLSVLNPNGSIFLLLSGGGASVVIADEIYNLGLGDQLANYGEYSGNPNTHETYLYAQQLLSLIAGSSAPRKVLFIGGAAANFTDIANTFAGIILAIDEQAESLCNEGVKVYVRRGGPRQKIGLARIEKTLKEHDLFGGVYDPTTSISDAVKIALTELE